LSFAIQTPVAIGPIDEYAMVILVWASDVCEKTNANTTGKFQRRYFANGLIFSLSHSLPLISRNFPDYRQESAPHRSDRSTWRPGSCFPVGRGRVSCFPAFRHRQPQPVREYSVALALPVPSVLAHERSHPPEPPTNSRYRMVSPPVQVSLSRSSQW